MTHAEQFALLRAEMGALIASIRRACPGIDDAELRASALRAFRRFRSSAEDQDHPDYPAYCEAVGIIIDELLPVVGGVGYWSPERAPRSP